MIKISIIVATHKNYRMPNDQMYFPLQVGVELSKIDCSFQKDNIGNNISSLNPYFCELTGLYWAWKNLDADYIGLVHYRRHFCVRRVSDDKFDNVLAYDDIKDYLGNIKVFVPKKRNYFIETLYSHYKHTHNEMHLIKTKEILSELYPDYISSYNKVLKRTWGYMFNMFIMDKVYLNQYCTWLFDILFKLFNVIDMRNDSSFDKRYIGRISEILFNVWLDYQILSQKIFIEDILELKIMYMERIDWIKKGSSFLKAKLLNKKYVKGF